MKHLTAEDRHWVQTQLALAGACPPPPPAPEAIRHPWTPGRDSTRCALCDFPEPDARHWMPEPAPPA